jgi:hypothetical protein
MADDFTVQGAEDFLKLSKALKAAGRTGLRTELDKELRRAVRPLIPMTQAAARRQLPSAGGFAEQVAREPQRVQVRTGATTAGVRIIVGRRRGGARAANRGVIRHPVFGNRDIWVSQRISEGTGWFDDTLEREAPRVARPAVEAAMETIVQRVVDGVR